MDQFVAATYRLRWILERTIRERPSFTADFRRLWTTDAMPKGSRVAGIEEHINPQRHSKTFLRTSVILDLTTAEATKNALSGIERMMLDRADFHFFFVGGVSPLEYCDMIG